MLINESLYVVNKPPQVIEQLSQGNIDHFLELARWGHAMGMDMASILLTHPEIDEVELLPRVARAIHEELGCPIGLDTRNAEAIEATLSALRPYKLIVWTVTAEQHLLDLLLPITKRYSAVIAGMPMGHYSPHVPMNADERVAEARIILEACEGYGIPQEDVVIDAMCMPASLLEHTAYQVTLETLRQLHQMGVTTQLGIGNAGSDMPGSEQINLAYLLGAMPAGLDSAFINPGIAGLIECVRAMDMFTGRDPECRRYLQRWRSINRP